MFLARPRNKSADRRIASTLHAAAVVQSRQPLFYAAMGAPDTVEGRFELLTTHVILLLDRLKDQPVLRQDLFDTYVSNLDGALREMGVGDLAMAKRMKGLGSMFYGRARAYGQAFAALPDETALNEVIKRTILRDQDGADPAPLATYVGHCRAALAEASTSSLLSGEIAWPAP